MIVIDYDCSVEGSCSKNAFLIDLEWKIVMLWISVIGEMNRRVASCTNFLCNQSECQLYEETSEYLVFLSLCNLENEWKPINVLKWKLDVFMCILMNTAVSAIYYGTQCQLTRAFDSLSLKLVL